MNSENTSDDASNSDEFVNLTEDIIPPTVKDQNIPAEYLLSDNFLDPGVITQYNDEQAQEQGNSFVIVQEDKIRTIATDAYLNNRYLYTFNIPVPQELQSFASNMEVHHSFCKLIGNPHVIYDFEQNSLVISSNNVDCEDITKYLVAIHFKNLARIMLLTESIDKLEVKLQSLKTENLLDFQFQVHPDLLKYYIIGKTLKI